MSTDAKNSMLWKAAQQVIGAAQQQHSSRAAADRAILPAQLGPPEAQNSRCIADSRRNCGLALMRQHLCAEVTKQRSGSRMHCAGCGACVCRRANNCGDYLSNQVAGLLH